MKKEDFIEFLTDYMEKISLNTLSDFFFGGFWVITFKGRLAKAV